MAELETATKTDEIQGTTILTATEPEKPAPEKTLFPTVDEAKAAAIKELETKAATDKAAADKATADAAAAEAAKKAGPEPKPEAKAADAPKKDDAAKPADYTLNLPENSALTKEDLDATLKEAKAAGLSEEKAKEMLQERDSRAKTVQTRFAQKQEQDLKTMVTTWRDTVKKDPELGGEHLAETAVKSSRAAKAIFDKETLQFLNDTGYGDHPGLVRAMVKVHDLIGEDKFIKGSTGIRVSTPTTTEEKAKKLFGNPIKEAVV